MSETRSSATDQEMSQTTLNKGQRQMDSVLKSWGFRTSRDPFQENSSQGLEANKGQKSTPLRRVVCPLERDDSSRTRAGITVRAVRALLEREPLKPTATQRICTRALGDSGVTKAGSLNQGFAAPNGRYHLRRGVINHSVRAHLCLRLGAGSEICRQLRSQGKLLDPMVWSVLHLHAEPVGFPWGIHQTNGWTLVGSHRAPRRTTRFFDVLTARVFQEKKP